MDMRQLAQMLIQQNPQVMNNPNAKEMLEVVLSGDSRRGTQMAMNLCQSYGDSKESAIAKATQFFRL